MSSHRETSSSSGHYTASCLADNHKYYYFSDTNVYEINEENLIRDEPYLLFYLRNDICENDSNDINIKNNTYRNNEDIEFKEDKEKKDKNNDDQNNESKLLTKNNFQAIEPNNNITIPKDFNSFSNTQNKEENMQKENKDKDKEKENKDIEIALSKFLSISNNLKFIIDYYYLNKNPYIWKLIIKSPEDSRYIGKLFEFKLDFTFGFKKVIEHIEIKNNNINLNFIDNKGYLSIDYKFIKNISCYQNLYQLFNHIYNLFLD